MKQVDYNKKIKTCEILGAKKFQKVVFGIESIKWKIVKRFFPNFIERIDKYIDKMKKERIKNAESQEEIDQIVRQATFSKMNIRKEFNKNSDINYHINTKCPTEFIEMLNFNKDIHKRNLIWNSIAIPSGIVLSKIIFWIGMPIVIFETCRALINLQCINIQNYNIYRIKRIEKKLIERENKTEEKNIDELGSAYEVIGKKIDEKKDIVSLDEIVNSINSKEQLMQLKEIIRREKMQRKQIDDVKGEKRL